MTQNLPSSAYWSFAFKNWYNYIALGLAAGLALIFKNEGLLYLGAAAEMIYLYTCVSNPRFRRHVDSIEGEKNLFNLEPLRLRLWPMIEEPLRRKFTELSDLAKRLDSDSISEIQKRDPFYKENRRKIAVLLSNYLQIAFAVTRYKEYLKDVNKKDIQKNIDRLEEEVLDADDRVRKVKMRNIEVLTKRLEKINKAEANSSYLAAHMETMEDTMGLVIDQAITMSDPKGMGIQIDNLLINLQETELIAREMESFSELEQGLSDEVFDMPEHD